MASIIGSSLPEVAIVRQYFSKRLSKLTVLLVPYLFWP